MVAASSVKSLLAFAAKFNLLSATTPSCKYPKHFCAAAQKLFCEKRLWFVACCKYAFVGKANKWSTFKLLKSVRFDLEPFCKSEKRKNQYVPTAKIILCETHRKNAKIFLCGRTKTFMPWTTKKMMMLRKNFFARSIFFKLLKAKIDIC